MLLRLGAEVAGAKKLRPSLAKTADRFELYTRAVQAPEVDVAFLSKVYRKHFRKTPKRLREDFCGTGAVAAEWVKRGKGREAFGVDLDKPTLDWGRARYGRRLPPKLQDRLHYVHADVRDSGVPPVDVICAQNFSYFVFKHRAELLDYFQRAFFGLAENGLFMVDLFGGYESIEDEREDETDHGDFRYGWEQHRYDPINAYGIYKIHFRFPDGSELEDAFVYDWRMWTLPEVREVMAEAGFHKVVVFWEDEDETTGQGLGTFSPKTVGTCDPSWNAYVVGVKKV